MDFTMCNLVLFIIMLSGFGIMLFMNSTIMVNLVKVVTIIFILIHVENNIMVL